MDSKASAKLADIVETGTDLPFGTPGADKEVKLVVVDAKAKPYSCEGKFLPMR